MSVPTPMPDCPFPRSRRLLKAAEFDRVFRARRSQSDGVIVLYACENSLPMSRLGLVVSRKCGNAAMRNRWKRCIREAFRLAQLELPAGFDLVVLPRVGATPTMPSVRQSLRRLADRLARRSTRPPSGAPPEATP
jgi:ribonuclease P protein component